MVLRTKKVSETVGMQVFTDNGDFLGDVEGAILESNKISGWKVRAKRNSYLTKALGGAKGVVIPHQLVKAVGSIFIVSRAAAPNYSEE
jgi:sporulation protein YlmC with PRC-barrel domain